MRKTTIIIACVLLLLLISAMGRAQTKDKFCCEAYAYFARRVTAPGTSVAGGGVDVFAYKGLAADGDVGTTIANSDDRITIGSAGMSYHFLSRNADRKVEPFAGAGFSFLKGDINTFGWNFSRLRDKKEICGVPPSSLCPIAAHSAPCDPIFSFTFE